jgi:hypothetical protein
LGKIVGFKIVLQRQFADFRDQAVMAGDHALEDPFLSGAIQTAQTGIAGPRGVNDRQLIGSAGFKIPLRQGEAKLVGGSGAHKAFHTQYPAALEHANRLLGAYQFISAHFEPLPLKE